MRVVQQSVLKQHNHICMCVCYTVCWYFVDEQFKGAAVDEQRFNQH